MAYTPQTLVDELYKGQTVVPTDTIYNSLPDSIKSIPGYVPPQTPSPTLGSVVVKPKVQPAITKQSPQKTTVSVSPIVPTKDSLTSNPNDNPNAIGPNPQTTPTPNGTPIYTGGSAVSDGKAPIGYRDIYGNIKYTSSTPTPGSVASITVDPQQAELDAIIANQKIAANQVVDPAAIYQQQLLDRQRQIDNINAMYADRLNRARIQGQGRIESRQFAQGRAGQIGSGTGEAGINAVQDLNTQQQDAIRNEQAVAIDVVLEKAMETAREIAKEKTAAKEKGIEAYTTSLKEGIAKKKKATSTAIASLVSSGIDITKMTPEQVEKYTKELGLSELELAQEFKKQADEARKAKLEEDKLAAEIEDKKAETKKTLADVENWGKLTEYQKGQLKNDGIKNANDYAIAKSKLNEDKALNKITVDTTVNKNIAAAQADGQWANWSKDERERFIRALGGTPSDYEI